MNRKPLAIALAIALPVAGALLAGCGSSASSDAAGPATTAAPQRQAAEGDTGITISPREPVRIGTGTYDRAQWETGATPANLDGARVDYNDLTVPMMTKGDQVATFNMAVDTEGGPRVKIKVKMQGPTILGFSRDNGRVWEDISWFPETRILLRPDGRTVDIENGRGHTNPRDGDLARPKRPRW